MNLTLGSVLDFADHVGVVEQMHYYGNGFFTVEGKTYDGKKFSISLHIKEEDKDGN